jgi:hypothetical protein
MSKYLPNFVILEIKINNIILFFIH